MRLGDRRPPGCSQRISSGRPARPARRWRCQSVRIGISMATRWPGRRAHCRMTSSPFMRMGFVLAASSLLSRVINSVALQNIRSIGWLDGGQTVGRPRCNVGIIKPDNRDVTRNVDLHSAQRVRTPKAIRSLAAKIASGRAFDTIIFRVAAYAPANVNRPSTRQNNPSPASVRPAMNPLSRPMAVGV